MSIFQGNTVPNSPKSVIYILRPPALRHALLGGGGGDRQLRTIAKVWKMGSFSQSPDLSGVYQAIFPTQVSPLPTFAVAGGLRISPDGVP